MILSTHRLHQLLLQLQRRPISGLISVVASLLLSACATTDPSVIDRLQPRPQELLRDASFAAPPTPIDAGQLLAMSPEMVNYAERYIRPQADKLGTRRALIDALYKRSALQISYDADYTRTAAEAFRDRRGNCLSLVIMTAAFAQYLNLPFNFRSVYVDELWSRSKELSFLAGHVNLSLSSPIRERRTQVLESDAWIVDFEPEPLTRQQRSVEISQSTVIAMYMSNRAAESLNVQRVDEAYWWARAALLVEPRYLPAYNTLGVVYRRHGDLSASEAVLRQVLSQEPDNLHALSNLALVLGDQGKLAERDTLRLRLSELQPVAPFKYLDDGIAAMHRGDYPAARALFAKQLARTAYSDEAHFWMALASYAQQDLRQAAEHLQLAGESSVNSQKRELYAAKLNHLRDLERLNRASQRATALR
ncbi:hypothetical protein RQP53_03105 [Paucibacter sp. APW11]|uniref:Transglutaminase-like domain-containing protein n=1 Tax=Roseateles aquae TaxID=3077235 RepID=A0ABU3P6S3_9BURK|nr:hypothetical protein [Paucibacter sp. APW11]MDT8998260.1 hypothetical protein [Paucibacter sp. APW11]